MTEPNENRAVRLVDIAREAGVSRIAVGRVLNGTGGRHVRVAESTRQRILAVAERLNYRPNVLAQQLRGARSQMFGVILDTVNTPVMYGRLAAIEREASSCGYRLMIGQVHQDFAALHNYLNDFQSRGVEGILCLFDLMQGYRRDLGEALSKHRRLVLHGRSVGEHRDCIRVDTSDAIFQATSHLIDRGRQRIGLLLWNGDDTLCELRREGYTLAHHSRELPLAEELIWDAQSPTAEPASELIARSIETMIVERKADAIIAPNDVWGVRIIKQLKQRGIRVPDDVAIVGYDNLDIAQVVDPALTSVDQRHDEYAKAAIEMLIDVADPQNAVRPFRTIIIKPRLIMRESS